MCYNTHTHAYNMRIALLSKQAAGKMQTAHLQVVQWVKMQTWVRTKP